MDDQEGTQTEEQELVETQSEAQEQSVYDKYLSNFEDKISEFLTEAKRGSTVKASALRARKLSLFLGEEMLHFRKISKANETAQEINESEVEFSAKER